MSSDLFEGIRGIQIKVEGGRLLLGLRDTDLNGVLVWDWFSLTDQQVVDAADLLLDFADEVWPLDPDDDGVTPNFTP